MNLSVSQIGRTIQTLLSGSQASMFREGGYEYRILVKVKDSENFSIDDILDMTLTSSLGEQISLRNVVEVRPRRGPVRIERRDRERVLNVTADYADRDMGAVMLDIREALSMIPIPRDFTIGFTGDYQEQQKA